MEKDVGKNVAIYMKNNLLDGRNKIWMNTISELLSPKHTISIVVGALHMLGDEGLISLFEQQGFQVSQI